MTDTADRTGVWRHFKGGYYKVIAEAVEPDTGKDYVLYQPCNEQGIVSTLATYTRLLSNFLEMVVPEGQNEKAQRFTYVTSSKNLVTCKYGPEPHVKFSACQNPRPYVG